jgi:hypothetical protein
LPRGGGWVGWWWSGRLGPMGMHSRTPPATRHPAPGRPRGTSTYSVWRLHCVAGDMGLIWVYTSKIGKWQAIYLVICLLIWLCTLAPCWQCPPPPGVPQIRCAVHHSQHTTGHQPPLPARRYCCCRCCMPATRALPALRCYALQCTDCTLAQASPCLSQRLTQPHV